MNQAEFSPRTGLCGFSVNTVRFIVQVHSVTWPNTNTYAHFCSGLWLAIVWQGTRRTTNKTIKLQVREQTMFKCKNGESFQSYTNVTRGLRKNKLHGTLLHKLTIAPLVKKCLFFMELESWLSYSHKPATGTCPEADESSLHPHLQKHPLSAVRDCLFNIFPATLHIWRPSPPSATWGGAMTIHFANNHWHL
jgi:hypothetical protein